MTTTLPTEPAFALPDKAALVNAVRAASAKQREAEIEQLALVAAMGEVWSVTDASCWDSVEPMPPNVLFGEQLVTQARTGRRKSPNSSPWSWAVRWRSHPTPRGLCWRMC